MTDENDKADKEKCVRWRKIAIDQLGYSINLTLTFTVAALGFALTLLKEDSFRPVGGAKCLMLATFIALLLSVIFGYCCTLYRLRDFRGTARRACNHPEAPAKDELRDIGKRSLTLFKIQVVAFAIGIGSLTFSLALTYGWKLR